MFLEVARDRSCFWTLVSPGYQRYEVLSAPVVVHNTLLCGCRGTSWSREKPAADNGRTLADWFDWHSGRCLLRSWQRYLFHVPTSPVVKNFQVPQLWVGCVQCPVIYRNIIKGKWSVISHNERTEVTGETPTFLPSRFVVHGQSPHQETARVKVALRTASYKIASLGFSSSFASTLPIASRLFVVETPEAFGR